MRGATTLLILICCLVSTPVFSQQVTYSARNVTLETVFVQLEKQTGYSFFYKTELIRQLPRVTVRFTNFTLEQAMDQCLKNMPVTYTILEKTVAITAKKRQLANTEEEPLISIRGKLTDEQNNALHGASVKIKDSEFGAFTNSEGEFELNLPDKEQQLVECSFVGYENKIVLYEKKTGPLFIKLKERTSQLGQVQVIGYGKTSKRLNTGNVSTLNETDITRQPVNNILAALQGRISGLNIEQKTGLPGGSFFVAIRGRNSLTGSNEPLFIVDGVPYPSGILPLVSSAQNGGNPLNYLDLHAIERVDILKDGDATAIYGTRGANGVVLITTKKGKAGKPVVNLNVNAGIGNVTTSPPLLNTKEFLELRREAKRNDNATIGPTDYDLNGTWDTSSYTDWPEYWQGNTAHTFNAHSTVSGGSEKTLYLLGIGNTRQSTVQPLDGDDILSSVLLNVSSSAFRNKLRIALVSNLSHNNCTVVPRDFMWDLYYLPPMARLNNPDGTFNQQLLFSPAIYTIQKYRNRTNNLVSNARLTYKLSNEVELSTSFGYHYLGYHEYQSDPGGGYDLVYDVSKAKTLFGNYKLKSWILEPQVVFKKKIKQGDLTGVFGATLQNITNTNLKREATGFTDRNLITDINAAQLVAVTADIYNKYKYNAVFGRLKFAWDQKYVLSLNGRYDGSSRFGPDKRYNFFGAIGTAWIFSAEKFISTALPFLSFGKLRASYGTTGNDGIQNYAFQSTYTNGNPYIYQPTMFPTRLYNPDLGWELTKKSEIGLDLGFLNERLVLNASYYIHRTSRLLLNSDLSSVTGSLRIYGNTDIKLSNTGLELDLFTTNITGKRLTWTSSFNFTLPKSRLTSFPNLENSNSYRDILVVGESVGTLKVFQFAGVNPQNGLYQFLDRRGNITQNPDPAKDKIALVRQGYKYYGGIRNTFTYKQFTLDLFVTFANQVGPNSFNRLQKLPPGLFALFAMPRELLRRWQKPGDITDVQRMIGDITMYGAQENAAVSTRAYSRFSSLWIKNVSFAYNLPAIWLKKARITSLQWYVQAQNLLTFPNDGQLDPEFLGGSRTTPPIRVIVTGIKTTF
ncbi:MAG: SusC/RagA family TonB-linked outer membrane protein [Chitinophagaceae bacterium]